jgi:polyphosphate glucokinase
VGAEIFVRGKTYDQTIGEHSRSMDEEHWGELLVMAVDGFVREFGANTVHLAGGNARRVTPTLFSDTPYRVVINGNQASIKGAAKLFYS